MKRNTDVFEQKALGGVILLLLFFIILPGIVYAEETDYRSLKRRLINEGFEKTWVQKLYGQPEVGFETRGLSLFFSHKEATLDYSQFLLNRSINKAKQYLNEHRQYLDSIEEQYGVNKEIIVAVMLVETRLGTNTGSSLVLNTLSTMAVLDDTDIRDLMWKRVPELRNRNRGQYIKWAKKKSKWAYNELKAFLKYTQDSDMNPIVIKGSYAGALGIPQFMPSNISKFAKDGDKDGRIDLFTHADAMASIASYLKYYGWKPGIDRTQQYKILLHYNYSKYYANTLIDIARKLKG